MPRPGIELMSAELHLLGRCFRLMERSLCDDATSSCQANIFEIVFQLFSQQSEFFGRSDVWDLLVKKYSVFPQKVVS